MSANTTETVGVVVLTRRSKNHLARCLLPLLGSALRPRVLVVDSSSADGTVEEAERLGAETLVIPRHRFNHGLTREMARKHLGTTVIVMVSPDAYALDETMLARLVEPVLGGQASLAYGRQIPREDATILEAFPRLFNYGEQSHILGWGESSRRDAAVFFCSDAWAAYRNAHLDDIGGFRRVLRGEDHVAAAMLLRQGYRVAYVADAVARHSHPASLAVEFRHYFEVGYMQKECEELFAGMASMDKRGVRYAAALSRELWKRAPHLLPYGLLHTATKWMGFRIGRASLNAPRVLKKMLSGQSGYFEPADPREKNRRPMNSAR